MFKTYQIGSLWRKWISNKTYFIGFTSLRDSWFWLLNVQQGGSWFLTVVSTATKSINTRSLIHNLFSHDNMLFINTDLTIDLSAVLRLDWTKIYLQTNFLCGKIACYSNIKKRQWRNQAPHDFDLSTAGRQQLSFCYKHGAITPRPITLY